MNITYKLYHNIDCGRANCFTKFLFFPQETNLFLHYFLFLKSPWSTISCGWCMALCWNIDQNMIYNPNFYCSCLSTGLSNIQSIIYNIFYLKQTIGCFFILKVRYEEDFEEFHWKIVSLNWVLSNRNQNWCNIVRIKDSYCVCFFHT